MQTAVLRWPRCHLFLELPGVQPHGNVILELGPHVLRRLGRLVQPENRCWGQMWSLQQEGVGMLRRRKGRRRRERVTSAQLPLEPPSTKPPARGSQVCEQLCKPLVQSVKRWGGMSGSDVLEFSEIIPMPGHAKDNDTHGRMPCVHTTIAVSEYYFITRTNHYYCRAEGQWGPRVIETILPRAVSSRAKTLISPPGQQSLKKSAFNY